MPNINLLEGKEFSREVEKVDEETISFQDFQEEEQRHEPEMEAASPETSTEAPKEAAVKETEPQPPRFGQQSSKWPIIAGIAGAAVLVFVFIYLYINYLGKEPTPSSPEKFFADSSAKIATKESQEKPSQKSQERTKEDTTTPSTTALETEPETEITGPEFTPELSKSREQAIVGASLLGDLLTAIPDGMRLFFFRYGGGDYTLEVGAGSSEMFQAFNQNLRNSEISALPEKDSEREEFIGDRVVTIQQMSGSLPMGREDIEGNQNIPSGSIRSELVAKVRQFGLQLREVDVAPRYSVDGRDLQLTTVKVFGDQSRVVEFVEDLLESYRNVGVNKLVVSVLSPTSLYDTSVSATLDLDVYVDL